MKDDLELSVWERIPREYKRQLYAFLAFDHFHAIREGRAKLNEAVDWIGYALDEIEEVHDQDGERAAVEWMKEKQSEALQCYSVAHRRYTEAGMTYLHVANGFDDTRGDVVFIWKGTSIGGKQDVETPTEKLPGAKAPMKRWVPWINWMGAQYFFQNDVADSSWIPAFWYEDLRFDELLITAMPVEDDNEIAALWASKLTALGADGREDFRLRIPTKSGPNYPDTLVERVGELIAVEAKSTVRDRLKRGGYEHPADLRRPKKPGSQRPKRRKSREPDE